MRNRRRAESVPARPRARRRLLAAAIGVGVGSSLLAAGAALVPAGVGAQVTTTTARPAATTTTRVAAPTTTVRAATTTAPRPASTAVATSAPAPVATTATPTTVATTAAPTTVPTTLPTTLPELAPPADAPFPASLVAPVPRPATGVVPELDLAAVHQAASEDPAQPDVVVRFRRPFTLPNASYEVSVLVGDPLGARVRASLRSTNPALPPDGTVELIDATSTRELGETTVLFDPSGMAVIRVPLASAPPGGAVWVEINEGAMDIATLRSPYWSREALFGSAPAGLLPTGTFGRVQRPGATATVTANDVVELPAGPVLTAGGGLAAVRYEGPAPTELLGQRIVESSDLLRIARNFDGAAATTDFISIDHLSGTLTLFDGLSPLPADRSGDRSWVVTSGTPPGSAPLAAATPGAPVTLTFDLTKVADALGTAPPSARTGLGLMRRFVLADGRIVTSDAVLGTSQWFDLAPASVAPTTAVVGRPAGDGAAVDTGDGSMPTAVLVGAGAAVLLLLLLLLVATVARRRSRRREDETTRVGVAEAGRSGATAGIDRVPWGGADDATLTARATAEIERVKAATGTVPVVEVPPAPVEPVGPVEAVGPRGAVARVEAVEPVEAVGPLEAVAPVAPGRRWTGVVIAGETVGTVTSREHPVVAAADAVAPPREAEPEVDEPEVDEPDDESDDESDDDDADDGHPASPPGVAPESFLAALDLDLQSLKARLGSSATAEPGPGTPRG